MKTPLRLAVLGAVLGFAGPHIGADVITSVRVIPSYSEGGLDNGARIDFASLPITLAFHSERFSFRATFPYLQMHAEIPVTYIGGRFFRFPVGGQTLDEDGPGDVYLAPSYAFVRGGVDRPWVWGGVRLKLPTADQEKYLGTGEFDYAPDVGILSLIGTRFLVMGSASYDIRGDPPNVDLANTLGLATAGRIRVGYLSGITLGVSRGSGAVPDGDPNWAVSTAYDHFFGNGYSLYGGVFKDLSSNGDAYGVAIGFTYRESPLTWGSLD